MKLAEHRITIGVGLTEEERLRHALGMSIRSPGLNPQNVFLLLVTLLKQQFPDDKKASEVEFRTYVEAEPPDGLGMTPDELITIVQEFRHPNEIGKHRSQATVDEMGWMRKRVERLLLGSSSTPGGDHGNQYTGGKRQVANGHLATTSSNSRARILARLDRAEERDGPHPEYAELAAKVRAKEMSARAAKHAAGWGNEPTPLETILKLLPRLTIADRQVLRGMLG